MRMLRETWRYGYDQARMLGGIKFSKDGGVEIKMRDPNRALELLAKHTGLIDTRPEGTEGDVVGIIWQKKPPSEPSE